MLIDKIMEMPDMPGRLAINALNNFLDAGITASKYADYAKMLPQLINEHETTIILLRKNIDAYDEKMGNVDTVVFLTNLMKQHENIAGILRRCMNKTVMN